MQLFGQQTSLAGALFCAPPQTNPATVHVVRLQRLCSSAGSAILGKEEMLEGNVSQSAEDLFSIPVHPAQTPIQKQICSRTRHSE